MTDDKDRMAGQERSERDYEETYGRGGGERFRKHDHPHSYPGPGAGGWRRALRAYVNGHDRGWEADRKYGTAGDEVADSRPGREEEPRREPAPGAGSEEADGVATARTDRGGTTFGVAVPDRHELTFHRSASTWRDALSPARRMPRHTGRELDAHRGTGDQA